MTHLPHPVLEGISVSCAVMTISDSRTPDTDRSGQLLQALLQAAGHTIGHYQIIPDEPDQIQATLSHLPSEIQAVICNGGTGIAPRDTTYDALSGLLEKTLPGFGELFRYLSFPEIGSRAMASRAIAGVYQNRLIFSLPGSTNGVRLAMEQLILPELPHLVKLLQG